MSDLLNNLLHQQSQYHVQLKQSENNYHQLTGALHVLNELIKVEKDRVGNEACDLQLQADSNLVLEEADVNVVHYESQGGGGDVIVKHEIQE